MKLFFPNGEHSQLLISQGGQLIGRDAAGTLAFDSTRIENQVAELVRKGDDVILYALGDGVGVNGKSLASGSQCEVKAGDLLSFGAVQARVVDVEKVGVAPAPVRPTTVDDASATRVRVAVPRFVLRGVSGAAFGKTYPVTTNQTIGRQADCDISIPSEEISRRHAQVRPVPEGLHVEDLGSSNGTFINGQRVQTGLLKAGEELRLDNIRFLLVAPGAEIPATSRLSKENEPAIKKSGTTIGWIAAMVTALAAAGAAAYYLF